MAEESQQSAISSAFPAPPPFYKSFSPSNLNRLQDHLESVGAAPLNTFNPTDPIASSLPDTTSLPSDLRNLVPPSIPSDGTYTTFETVHAVKPTTSESAPPPTQAHLVELLHRILLKFLHITHVLAIDPSMKFYGPVWDQLDALFKEMHDGINAWRPHQARESLIAMMEGQIEKIKSESERVRESVGSAKEVVEGIGKSVEGQEENGTVSGHGNRTIGDRGQTQKKRKKEETLWELIDRKVGNP